ncbi:MAG: helix-turn-helix domain-containing protein [Mycobacterium sp.]
MPGNGPGDSPSGPLGGLCYCGAVARYLTASQAARVLGVSGQTIRRLSARGYFPGLRHTPGGHLRIPAKVVKKRASELEGCPRNPPNGNKCS